MSRRPAAITQADIARAIRAAMKAGAAEVEVRVGDAVATDILPSPAAHALTSSPLFIDDQELRQRINPRIGRDRFRSAIRAIETKHSDFPPLNPLWKGRYWPAVRSWLDRQYGVGEDRVIGGDDGEETWDARPK